LEDLPGVLDLSGWKGLAQEGRTKSLMVDDLIGLLIHLASGDRRPLDWISGPFERRLTSFLVDATAALANFLSRNATIAALNRSITLGLSSAAAFAQ
jgi:hypothetical protein